MSRYSICEKLRDFKNRTHRAISKLSSRMATKPKLFGTMNSSTTSDFIDPLTITINEVTKQLIRSCALLAFDKADAALELADYALRIAEEDRVYYLQSKCQYYRGLCLMELRRWKEASVAFTRAASVREWAGRVAVLKTEAEWMIEEVEGRRPMRGK